MLTLSATDTGSGVKELRYWVNGGTVNVIAGSSTSFSINSEGVFTINLRAIDNAGNISALETKTVRIDTTAPQITLTTNTLVLFPPDHSYQTFIVSDLASAASDSGDNSVDISDVVIAQATSDEAEDSKGNGDAKTRNDIIIAPNCKSVQLRRERAENENGRVYKITLKVKDTAGNTGIAVRQVFVPLTNGGTATDSGAKYTVNGCSP
jgi:hypothetical protein